MCALEINIITKVNRSINFIVITVILYLFLRLAMYLKHSIVGMYYKGGIAVSKTANVGSIPAVPVIAE